MKYKLEDIDKNQSFKVPEGYFEDLPLKVQTRIEKNKKHSQVTLPSWKFALAASILVFLITFFHSDQNPDSAEKLLAEVPQDELIAYLDNIEIDFEELATTFPTTSTDIDFENLDGLDEIEMNDNEIDDILLEYDLADDYL